jgi:cobaltochelatase CobN
MQHGYAGARTIGSEFTEYLWGWQVTNPDIIKSWAWDEVKSVYLDDRYHMGVNRFLEQGANVHVKTNMMAILMVAAQKGFWQADEQTLQQVARQWADLLLKNGLPGSGHTRPDHPVFKWVMPLLREDQRQPLQAMLDKALVQKPQAEKAPATVAEINAPAANSGDTSAPGSAASAQRRKTWGWLALLAAALALFVAGFVRSRFDSTRPISFAEGAR